MWNARLDDSQSRIKVAGRNINNIRYAGDTSLKAENEAELKSLLMRMKDKSEKAGLTLNIKKCKIMSPDPVSSWQREREKLEAVTDFIFLGSKITVDNDCNQ